MSMPLSDTVERIESLKTGAIASSTTAIAALLFHLAHHRSGLPLVLPDQMLHFDLATLLSIGMAGFTGFLFGVTYRYIIRLDANSHLKAGAVMAFGLTRGLAQIDTGMRCNFPTALLPSLVSGLESMAMMAIAAFCLERALHQGWIKPFGTSLAAIPSSEENSPLVDKIPLEETLQSAE